MNKKYINLPSIRGQKIRKKYYCASAVKHPAKADIPMMIWILKNFVKDGDIVLDPMAGIGGTLIEGMRLFPDSLFIGVELEEKFVKWCNASIKKTEKIAKEDWFMKVGKAVCFQGDARDLQRVLKKKADKIVTSPPWGGQVQHKTNYLGKQKRESGFEYSDNPENIGNLPHGKVDKVITSPPYSETMRKGQGSSDVAAQSKRFAKLMEERDKLLNRNWGKNRQTEGRLRAIEAMLSGYSRNPENIGNLKHGDVDKIVTSPPFGQAQSGGGIAKKGYTGDKHSPTDLVGKRSYMPENVGEGKKNISNLPYGKEKEILDEWKKYFDKLIEEEKWDELIKSEKWNAYIEELIRQKKWNEYYKEMAKLPEGTYRSKKELLQDADRILKKLRKSEKQQTYLEAMFLVYQQCYKVLKSDGLMILITKDFIRKGKRIPLGEDTIKLCKLAGFEHAHTYHREIKNPSFWRILYEQKYPSADKIKCEDIIILKK